MAVKLVPEVTGRVYVVGCMETEMGFTIKLTLLLAIPPTVTTTFPVVAPFGTTKPMMVELQDVGVTVNLPRVRLLDP